MTKKLVLSQKEFRDAFNRLLTETDEKGKEGQEAKRKNGELKKHEPHMRDVIGRIILADARNGAVTGITRLKSMLVATKDKELPRKHTQKDKAWLEDTIADIEGLLAKKPAPPPEVTRQPEATRPTMNLMRESRSGTGVFVVG
jgi:hypothetical protein